MECQCTNECISIQTEVSAFVTGTSENSYPKDLFAFTSWIDQFGDHFAGDCRAYHALQNEMKSIKQIHSVLQDEQRALSKAYAAVVKVELLP
jgi:hypothetical protein